MKSRLVMRMAFSVGVAEKVRISILAKMPPRNDSGLMSSPSQLPPYAHCFRTQDPDRYLSALLASEHVPFFLTLGALEAELSHIREAVKEPMIALIRLAWWREAIAELEDGQPPRHHPVLTALAPYIQSGKWHTGRLQPLLDAHELDFESVPFPNWEALFDYAGNTAGTLAVIEAEHIGLSDTATEHARNWATAWQVLTMIRRAPLLDQQGWRIIPAFVPSGTWASQWSSLQHGLHHVETLLASAPAEEDKNQNTIMPFLALKRFAHRYARDIHRFSTAGHFRPIPRKSLVHTLLTLRLGMNFFPHR